jgi:hypothetical protein
MLIIVLIGVDQDERKTLEAYLDVVERPSHGHEGECRIFSSLSASRSIDRRPRQLIESYGRSIKRQDRKQVVVLHSYVLEDVFFVQCMCMCMVRMYVLCFSHVCHCNFVEMAQSTIISQCQCDRPLPRSFHSPHNIFCRAQLF